VNYLAGASEKGKKSLTFGISGIVWATDRWSRPKEINIIKFSSEVAKQPSNFDYPIGECKYIPAHRDWTMETPTSWGEEPTTTQIEWPKVLSELKVSFVVPVSLGNFELTI
jgi:hypothetical protein